MNRRLTTATAALLLAAAASSALPDEATAQPNPHCVVPVDAPAPQLDPEPADATHLHDFATGQGVRVAVIDTGVAPHPELGEVEPVADLVDAANPNPLTDCDGHGTVVAGVIAGTTLGVAPHAQVLSVRQTSAYISDPSATNDTAAESSGTLASLAEAVDAAVSADAHVINVSVVACVPGEVAVRLDSGVLDEALRRAEDANVVVVAAAGNLSPVCDEDSVVYPTHYGTVLGIGARANDFDVADYSLSTPADRPVLSAPALVPRGLSPTSAGWASAVQPPGSAAEPSPFQGTSFAAPIVAGTAALLRERYTEYSAADIRSHIIAASQPAGGAVSPAATLAYVPSHAEPQLRQVAVSARADSPSPIQHRALAVFAALAVLSGIGIFAAGLFPRARPRTRPSASRSVPRTPGSRSRGCRRTTSPTRSRRRWQK